MDPVHRLIISGAPFKRFKWVCAAYRTNGGIYEIDTQQLFQSHPALKYAEKEINSALFLLVEVKDSIGEYYLTIIDRDSKDEIKKYSWHLQNSTNYWHTNRAEKALLHQYVVYLSGQIVSPGYVIHHAHFYTFDNRRKTLAILSESAHQLRHLDQKGNKIKIDDFIRITNDAEFLDFITSVF